MQSRAPRPANATTGNGLGRGVLCAPRVLGRHGRRELIAQIPKIGAKRPSAVPGRSSGPDQFWVSEKSSMVRVPTVASTKPTLSLVAPLGSAGVVQVAFV
jgi:hypothetical protein